MSFLNKIENVDPEASFRELGADSLMMFSIRSDINKMLQIDLHISMLYSYPSIKKLTEYLVYELLKMDKK